MMTIVASIMLARKKAIISVDALFRCKKINYREEFQRLLYIRQILSLLPFCFTNSHTSYFHYVYGVKICEKNVFPFSKNSKLEGADSCTFHVLKKVPLTHW